VASAPAGAIDPTDRQTILKLAFGYVEPRHRLGLLDDSLQADIIGARRAFRASLPAELAGAVHFHEPAAVNPAATMQDNVLFGRIVDTFADAADRVSGLLRETMDALDLTDAAIELGLAFDIGSGGKRLSSAQQQKLALSRALMKRPDVLVVNRALSALDAAAQDAIIQRVLRFARSIGERGMAVYWVLGTPSSAGNFDRTVAFESGHVVRTVETPPAIAEEAQLARVG
jgi:putative ABC transport system ATP-binding protein